jgi:hypothetical protein
VQDGKFAVIRGLPDRFVVAQLNGVRLPSADADTRAVELDQFPSAIIESIQVSKTFTPDQQGDASGGTVNVVLKSVPRETILEIKGSLGYNTQVADREDFLTYSGGGVNFLANDRGSRDMPVDPADFGGAAGVSRGTAPGEYKWSAAIGGGHEFDSGVRIGGFASFFYDRGASFYDNGIDDRYWQRNPGEGLVPRTIQGTPEDGDFKTSLFDVSKGSQSVQWGGLLSGAIESENHTLAATYLYTRDAEDSATLAEDTRGKEYFFPGYDPDDIENEGNLPSSSGAITAGRWGGWGAMTSSPSRPSNSTGRSPAARRRSTGPTSGSSASCGCRGRSFRAFRRSSPRRSCRRCTSPSSRRPCSRWATSSGSTRRSSRPATSGRPTSPSPSSSGPTPKAS